MYSISYISIMYLKFIFKLKYMFIDHNFNIIHYYTVCGSEFETIFDVSNLFYVFLNFRYK